MCRVVPSHKKIVSANERNEFVGSGRRTIPLHGRAHFQPTTAHAREHLFLPRSSTLLTHHLPQLHLGSSLMSFGQS